MRFTGQNMAGSDPQQRDIGESLCAWIKESDFDHPAHLKQVLQDMAQDRGWTVSSHYGVTNVHGPNGILVRIKPI